VCRECIGWLRARIGAPETTPILPVRDMAKSAAFYERVGFGVRLYEPDGGYAFVELAGESVFDLSATETLDPATNGAGCYMIIDTVDDLHDRFATAGLSVTDVAEEPWGMREFTLTDPDGNHLRIGHGV
jgi:hydroxymethylpyrimidine/phosphomethylpyrimidine kinase